MKSIYDEVACAVVGADGGSTGAVVVCRKVRLVMKRIAVLIAVFAAVMAILNLIACPIPYSAAQALPAVDSPLPTPSLELTPPHRPTPTQGPPPQPDSEPPGGVVRDDPRPTPVTRGIVTEMEPAAIEPAPLPVWAREIVALIRTLVWPAWKWDTLE